MPKHPTLNQRRRQLVLAGAWSVPLASSTLLAACGGGSDGGDPADGVGTNSAPQPVPAPQPPALPPAISSFGLVVLPDTQFYSRYATAETGNQFEKRYGSTPYAAQTQWIADNAAAFKIPFVIHVGDVVDQVGKPQQWEVADQAMQILEQKGVPYSVLAGNHDVLSDIGFEDDPDAGTDATRDLTREPYLKWFGSTRAARQGTFGARDASGFHEYHIFTAEGQKFLVLSLSWRVSEAGIAWARKVLRDHPTLPTVLVNHQLIAIANDGVKPLEVDYGLMLWERLIKDNDQIFMTVNGHHHGAARLSKINDFGNAVEEMVVDYQMAYQGGNGLLRFYEFDLSNNEIRALSFSPWVKQKPKATLNEFDQVMLKDANNEFTIKMDFAKRFARFAPDFKAARAANTVITAAVTAHIMNGYTGTAVVPARPAANAEDYPHVAETVAHWRFFGGAEGTALAAGAVIADASGRGNALTRAPLKAPASNTAQLDDLQWSSERHRLSSAPGSVQFRNSTKTRLSYFLTAAAATANRETFTTGYTIEAFVKLDKTWTAQVNKWMNIMTRQGRRGDAPGYSGGDPEAAPVLFAISNLREVQWEIVPAQGTASPRSNWSGEILLDTWLHIAIVNDPATRETTMYVEGAPVLRNTIDTLGIASMNMPWSIGAGNWDNGDAEDGFLGSIGEIRIVSKPLAPAQWLTARAS